MTPDGRHEITFLDDEGQPVAEEDLDGGDPGTDRRPRRFAVDERWWPDGGGAAITGLLFVLVAWIGASPLVQAVTFSVPQGQHRIGELTEDSLTDFGGGEYYGVTPGLIPVITFGTRAVVVLIALALGLRARRREHSPLAAAAVATSSLSLLLFVVAGAMMTVGLAMGHGGFYSSPF